VEKRLIDEFYNYADAGHGTVKKYMAAMEKKHGMKAMWSLELDTKLRDRYRVMAWCRLYRLNKREPSEYAVTELIDQYEGIQRAYDDIEAAIEKLRGAQMQVKHDFMRQVGYKWDGESVGRIMIGCMLKD